MDHGHGEPDGWKAQGRGSQALLRGQMRSAVTNGTKWCTPWDVSRSVPWGLDLSTQLLAAGYRPAESGCRREKSSPMLTLGRQPQGSIRFMQLIIIIVEAKWDNEAHVWFAESPTLPGLITEADALELMQKSFQPSSRTALFRSTRDIATKPAGQRLLEFSKRDNGNRCRASEIAVSLQPQRLSRCTGPLRRARRRWHNGLAWLCHKV
jgi:hypothetical protein